jgi:tRNA A37 threonylcarbamoyladenosine synthetase subunit TsaC/SUA5/YrdC
MVHVSDEGEGPCRAAIVAHQQVAVCIGVNKQTKALYKRTQPGSYTLLMERRRRAASKLA